MRIFFIVGHRLGGDIGRSMKQQVCRLLAFPGSVCVTSNLISGATADILTPYHQRQLDFLLDLPNDAFFSGRNTSIFDRLVSRLRHNDPVADDNELTWLKLSVFLTSEL